MSKSAKSEKPPKKNTSKKNRSKIGSAASTGRLIALEGTRGKDLTATAELLARQAGRNGDAGWSLWDASNTFYELSLSKARNLAPPPRTLLLLYASDLMFRLRWEIEPALLEGQTVIAAPYVESAIAMGIALGLSKEWLDELFRFVRKPDAAVRLKEKVKRKNKSKKKDKKKPANSFVEFCCESLAATSPEWDPIQLREAVLQYLDTLEEKNEIWKLGKKLPKELLAGG
jgi:thymidylate kinase